MDEIVIENGLNAQLKTDIERYDKNQDSDFWSKKPKDGNLHISEGIYCLRKGYYKRYLSKKLDFESEKTFWLGNKIEDRIQDYLEIIMEDDFNGEFERNIKLRDKKYKDIDVKGETDGKITRHYKDFVRPKKWLVEIKSTSYMPNEPKEQHLKQIHSYCKMLEIMDYFIIYVDKKNYEIKVFQPKIEKTSIENDYFEVVDNLQNLNKFLQDEKLPPKNPFYDWECKYCDYKDECDRNLNINDINE